MNHFRWKIKALLLLGIFVFLSVLTVALSRGLKANEAVLSHIGPLMESDIQIQDFSFIQTQNGHNAWEIKASLAKVFENKNEAFLEGLEVKFLLPEGFGLEFEGKQGRLDTQSHNFEVSSGDREIEILFNNGYKIATRSLQWSNQDKRILTVDPVEIRGPGFKINGEGMEAHLALQELKVLSDVRAEVF